MRETLYKERTNVLSYYVIKTVMMNDYPAFLSWCDKNNFSLFAFKKTYANQDSFCNFIDTHYKTSNMTENVNSSEQFLNYIKNTTKKKLHPKTKRVLLSNLRMTICELG